MKKIPVFSFLILALLLTSGAAEKKKKKAHAMTWLYIEYNRGYNFNNRADFYYSRQGADYRFESIDFTGHPFQSDVGPLPVGWIKPLLNGKFGTAANKFTDPYYGFRIHYFFRKFPNWGIGVDFTHFKIYMKDPDQVVPVSGNEEGIPFDRQIRIGDHFYDFSISHGVNHVSLVVTYRWMLQQSERIPDGRWQPFASLAIGPAFPHLQMITKENGELVDRANSYQSGLKNWGMGLFAGLRWKSSPHFGLYFEYKFTYSILNGMFLDDPPDGRARCSFPNHHLLWGFSYML